MQVRLSDTQLLARNERKVFILPLCAVELRTVKQGNDLKSGKRAVSESVWYGSFNLVRQTSLISTGSAALCDTKAAADSDAAPLMCRI